MNQLLSPTDLHKGSPCRSVTFYSYDDSLAMVLIGLELSLRL